MYVGQGEGLPAMGAMLGVVVAEVLSLAVLAVFYFFGKERTTLRQPPEGSKAPPLKLIAGSLWKGALGVLAGCAIVPLAACVDSLMVANCMRGLNYTAPQVQSAFALYTGIASPMTYFPALVCAGLALGLVPRIQGHLARRDFASMRDSAASALKMTALLALPAAVGLIVLAGPLTRMAFGSLLDEEQIALASTLLYVMAAGVFFLAVAQTSAGILASVGKPGVAAGNLVMALVLKVIVQLILMTNSGVNLVGAAFGSLAFYGVLAAFNMVQVVKRMRLSLDWGNALLKPLIACVCMGALVYFVYFGLLEKAVGVGAGVILTVLIGFLVYLGFLVFTRVFNERDFEQLPGGGVAHDILLRSGIYK